MKSHLKTLGLIALALSFAACSPDKAPKKEMPHHGLKPSHKTDAPTTEVTATAEVSFAEAVMQDDKMVNPATYTLKVNLPEDKKTTVEYNLTLLADDLKKEDFTQVRNLKDKEGKDDTLTRVQVLDSEAKSFVVTRFATDKFVEGETYIFIVDKDGKTQLVTQMFLDKTNTDATIVKRILDAAEANEATPAEAILELAKLENGFMQAETAADETTLDTSSDETEKSATSTGETQTTETAGATQG
jgi:hypothetical protein